MPATTTSTDTARIAPADFRRDVNNTRIGVARGVKKAMIGKVLGGNGGGSDIVMQAIGRLTTAPMSSRCRSGSISPGLLPN